MMTTTMRVLVLLAAAFVPALMHSVMLEEQEEVVFDNMVPILKHADDEQVAIDDDEQVPIGDDEQVPIGTAINMIKSMQSDEIVNGKDSEYAGKFPWQGSLQYRKNEGYYYGHTCGASLVSSRWAVTAAHCVVDNYNNLRLPSQMSVIFGANELSKSYVGKPVRYEIQQIIKHESYDPDSTKIYNDIALLKFKSDVETNSYVKTIDLVDEGEDVTGYTCRISGWGLLYGGAPSTPDHLQYLDTDVLSGSSCSRYLGNYHGSHLCTMKAGSSACQGDSGGPLACSPDYGSTWKLAGAASFVFGSCSTSAPSVYSSVAYNRNWIRGYTGL